MVSNLKKVIISKNNKSEKSETSFATLRDMIKLFPNEITTNNSLVNNPSINKFNDLITVKVSKSKEDSYEFDPQKITFKNFMEIRTKPLKRCGTASENISSRKDNDSTKFNKTINGNIPPEAKINSKLKMLMNSHEFASIFDQIKMPNEETFGIDLRDPLNYSRKLNKPITLRI